MFDNKSKNINIRNLVTGGAGFLGSHLIDKLMNLNQEVICLDNYFTGDKSNIKILPPSPLLAITKANRTPFYGCLEDTRA